MQPLIAILGEDIDFTPGATGMSRDSTAGHFRVGYARHAIAISKGTGTWINANSLVGKMPIMVGNQGMNKDVWIAWRGPFPSMVGFHDSAGALLFEVRFCNTANTWVDSDNHTNGGSGQHLVIHQYNSLGASRDWATVSYGGASTNFTGNTQLSALRIKNMGAGGYYVRNKYGTPKWISTYESIEFYKDGTLVTTPVAINVESYGPYIVMEERTEKAFSYISFSSCDETSHDFWISECTVGYSQPVYSGIVTLVPNSDAFVNYTGGGYATVDGEDNSDATYITGASIATEGVFGLTDPPASKLWTQATISVRAKTDASDNLRFNGGASTRGTAQVLTASFAKYTSDLVLTQATSATMNSYQAGLGPLPLIPINGSATSHISIFNGALKQWYGSVFSVTGSPTYNAEDKPNFCTSNRFAEYLTGSSDTVYLGTGNTDLDTITDFVLTICFRTPASLTSGESYYANGGYYAGTGHGLANWGGTLYWYWGGILQQSLGTTLAASTDYVVSIGRKAATTTICWKVNSTASSSATATPTAGDNSSPAYIGREKTTTHAAGTGFRFYELRFVPVATTTTDLDTLHAAIML